VSGAGAEGDGASLFPALSADGRFVAFPSNATHLVADDSNGKADAFVRGPRLTLEALPEIVPPGGSLALTVWRGAPGGVALLEFVEGNGTPASLPFATGVFDPDGIWSLAGDLPFGAFGVVHALRAVGLTSSGAFERTDRETITFQ
jgi:hypothetical protein